MKDKDLIWKTTEIIPLLHTRVFDVQQQTEISSTGITGDYVALTAPEWVVTVPVYKDCFVMVRQWRHGEDRITVELPGGVCEPGEDPASTAHRELLEETGFNARKITLLGTCSSNPALFKNHFRVYLAEDLISTGKQHLDPDELLNYELIPINDVIRNFGTGEYTHAFSGTALFFYLRHRFFSGGGNTDNGR